MARTILIEAAPWNAATGAAVAVALAGGGVRAYRHRARNDWRAGVVAEPRFQGRIDFDQDGFAGGARPQFAPLEFSPASIADLATLSGYLWNGAPIEVFVGDDELAVPVWTTLIKGTVELQTVRGGTMALKVRDVTADLDIPVASDRFLGTGGIEGDAIIAERLKRRSFGRCSNIEAQIFKESTLIYEVGDPSKPLQAIDDIKDIGRSASAIAVVAWAGSFAATLAALEAQAVTPGGGAAAPSIALVKWWTRPVGPLTVDLRGEVGAGYVETAASIAQRVIATRSAITVSNVATADGWRPGEAGIHFDSESETIAQGLDRLIRGSSLAWAAEPAGTIILSRISFEAPVETVKVIDAARSLSYKPLLRRRVGYRRNHRVHNESELSAAPALGLIIADTPPSAEASSPGQIWQDVDGRYWERRASTLITIAGVPISIGGEDLTITFQPTALQPVRDGLDAQNAEFNAALLAVTALANDAQATADGKVQTFYQASAPTAEGVGDLWFDTDDGNKQYRWSGSAWVIAQDASIGTAITAAAGAQATADGKVTTFFASSAPTAEAIGDLWYNSTSNYLLRWSGSAWVDIANIGATAAQISQIGQALTDAANAQATADGKIDSYYQASAPGGATVGDIWFDTDDGNKQYRHNGSTFVVAQDTGIGAAISAAAGAQATADGKVTTFTATSAPTADGVGDLWFNTTTKELLRWNGSTWGSALVDLTSSAQVSIVAPATFTIYRTSAGAVKPDQLPVDLIPSVTRGGVDYLLNNAVDYSVVGTGGLAGKVTVNNTDGSSNKGKITIANTVTGAGTIQLSVSVDGISLGTYITPVVTADDAPPSNNGGAGGTDSSLEAINSTTYAVMTSQDGGDPVLDVAITSGQTLRLAANFYYRTTSGSPEYMTCKAEYYNGSTWLAMDSGSASWEGSGAQRLEDPVEFVLGEMVVTFTKTGLATGTYPVRLLGKLSSGSALLTPTTGGATSSRA